MLFILILLYIQITYSYNVTINSDNIPDRCILNSNVDIVSKAVMNNNEYRYYCKNNSDTCVTTNKYYNAAYIKFPDENGNIKTYIAKSCIGDDLTKCYDGNEYQISKTNETVFCSYRCTKDSDCLSNKCMFTNQKDPSQINIPPHGSLQKRNNITDLSIGYCVFNNNSPVIQCDKNVEYLIFNSYEHFYVHCGKLDFDKCITDEECSSKICRQDRCIPIYHELSYKSSRTLSTNRFIVTLIFIVSISTCCCCFVCYSIRKHNKLSKKKKIIDTS